jgi:putative phosphoribosyl transferase
MEFKDRREAGQRLGRALEYYRDTPVVVYGLARGGVVVAAEVARHLDAPLDVIVARKIGHPYYPEYAVGAVAEMGKPVWNGAEIGTTTEEWRKDQVALARREIKRRKKSYQGDQSKIDVAGKVAIVVDDGIATGLTMIAALRELHYRNPLSIVVAVPVAPRELPWGILRYSDAHTYVLYLPATLGAVGMYYRNFDQVTDEEVRQLLKAYQMSQEEPLDLPALYAVLSTVTEYPVTDGELLERAVNQHAPENVVTFFESIPKDEVFEDRADVMIRADEAEVLMEEEMSD